MSVLLETAIAAIEFDRVSRHYGQVKAVDSVSVTIRPGEFFSMLGPSGSGKTTCLRLVAGFEHPTAGRVLLNGKDVSGTPPYERDVNTVFQDYALFPHLSVLQNVEYGLRVKGIAAAEARQRAGAALEQVALSAYGERRPAQLSGGERQRVALARALVNRPPILLLDEPLGALDLRLREQMQVELKKLHRQLGITFVYVTHDQSEAMSMSDRVAVFAQGRIEQVDSPSTLYQRPATGFVAQFVGGSNVLTNELARRVSQGRVGTVSIRPEQITVLPANAPVPADHVSLEGVLADIQYHGATSRLEVELDGRLITAAVRNHDDAAQTLAPGAAVRVSWPAAATVELAS